MNRNWVHIQDGTKENDKYDLTVTTLDSTTVGKVVVVEGTVAVNKDFGAGYFYEVIVENAKLK
jgi:aspartyl/asparaginyl-tRNA synthetase